MICNWCTEQQHKDCINFWRVEGDSLVKRDEPLDHCFCQHRKNAVIVRQKIKDTNGDGS